MLSRVAISRGGAACPLGARCAGDVEQRRTVGSFQLLEVAVQGPQGVPGPRPLNQGKLRHVRHRRRAEPLQVALDHSLQGLVRGLQSPWHWP